MSFYFNRDTFPYCSTARAAHDLADLLKRVRPDARCDVERLQRIVTRAHKKLDEANSSPEIANAWCDLNAAYHALHDLRHRHHA